MKKLIRYLSDISGVTMDIQRETFIDIGNRIDGNHYWFNRQIYTSRVLSKIAESLKHYSYWDINRIRNEVDEETKETIL